MMNAFDEATLLELNEGLQRAMTDDSVYVVILSGRGRGFCSGADITSMDGREDRESKHRYGAHLWLVQNIDRLLYFGEKPTVAAVNGPAVGAGCDFALACDLRVMAEGAFCANSSSTSVSSPVTEAHGSYHDRLVRAKRRRSSSPDATSLRTRRRRSVSPSTSSVMPKSSTPLATWRTNCETSPATAVRGSKKLIDTAQSFEEYTWAALEEQWKCVNDPEHTEAVDALLEGRPSEFDRDY